MHSISALTQLTLVLLSACEYICIYKVQRATHMTMKKIYSNPRLGVSRPATAMVINLSKEKRWQIKAFKCSYFLYTSERIDVSPRSATNYPQREKQLAADSWMWGIHSLRRSHTQTDRPVWNSVNLTAPSTHRAQLLPYWCNADTWGNIPPKISLFCRYCLLVCFMLRSWWQLNYIWLLHLSYMPSWCPRPWHTVTLEAIYSITIFSFFNLVCSVKDRLYQIIKRSPIPLKLSACECHTVQKSPLLLMCVLQINLLPLHALHWASLTDSSRDGDIMEAWMWRQSTLTEGSLSPRLHCMGPPYLPCHAMGDTHIFCTHHTERSHNYH